MKQILRSLTLALGLAAFGFATIICAADAPDTKLKRQPGASPEQAYDYYYDSAPYLSTFLDTHMVSVGKLVTVAAQKPATDKIDSFLTGLADGTWSIYTVTVHTQTPDMVSLTLVRNDHKDPLQPSFIKIEGITFSTQTDMPRMLEHRTASLKFTDGALTLKLDGIERVHEVASKPAIGSYTASTASGSSIVPRL